MLALGARAWPGAVWRRVRGVAYVPGDLTRVHLWIALGLLLALAGTAAVALEWGLRDFQSYGEPVLAGRLDVQAGPQWVAAVWSDSAGRRTRSWSAPCERLVLEGEFLEWGRAAHLAGFRDRHRVSAARLLCGADTAEAGGAEGRLRRASRTWEALRRWDRFVPGMSTSRRVSPTLRVSSGSWRVFVMPAGYVFSE